jgi:hypothetical protein
MLYGSIESLPSPSLLLKENYYIREEKKATNRSSKSEVLNHFSTSNSSGITAKLLSPFINQLLPPPSSINIRGWTTSPRPLLIPKPHNSNSHKK